MSHFFTVMLYGRLYETAKPTKTWKKTSLQYLVRHKSGRYYARFYVGGKEVWTSLGTSHFSMAAEAKLTELKKKHRQRVSHSNGEVSAKMTFGEAADLHLRNLDDNRRINCARGTIDDTGIGQDALLSNTTRNTNTAVG